MPHTQIHTAAVKTRYLLFRKADVTFVSTKRSRKKIGWRNFSRRYLTNASGKDLAELQRLHSDVI